MALPIINKLTMARKRLNDLMQKKRKETMFNFCFVNEEKKEQDFAFL